MNRAAVFSLLIAQTVDVLNVMLDFDYRAVSDVINSYRLGLCLELHFVGIYGFAVIDNLYTIHAMLSKQRIANICWYPGFFRLGPSEYKIIASTEVVHDFTKRKRYTNAKCTWKPMFQARYGTSVPYRAPKYQERWSTTSAGGTSAYSGCRPTP